MTADRATLDAALLAAHAGEDSGALIGLYAQAAAQSTDPQAAWFYLTHAYVFALEQGDVRADTIGAKLAAAGRA